MVAIQLNSEQAGLFFLLLSIMLTMATTLRFGLGQLLVRGIAASLATARDGQVVARWLNTSIIVAAASVFASVLIWFYAAPLASALFGATEMSDALRAMVIGLPFLSQMLVNGLAYQGLGKPQGLVLLQHFAFQFPCIIFMATMSFANSAELAKLWSAITVITAGLSTLILWRLMPKGGDTTHSPLIEWAAAARLWWIQIASALQQHGMPIAVGALLSLSHAGWFYVAYRLGKLVGLVLDAINLVTAPKLAAASAANDNDELESLVRQTSIAALGVGLPLTILLCLAAPHLLGLFGDDFRNASTALQLLALGQFAYVVTGPARNLLLMTHNEKFNLYTTNLHLTTLVLLGAVLVPSYGLEGAAIAISGAMLSSAMSSLYFVYSALRFNPLTLRFS